MKKLVLCFIAGSVSLVSQAQLNSSVMLKPAGFTSRNGHVLSSEETNKISASHPKGSVSRGARTTGYTNSDWYDLWDQNYTTNSVGYYFEVFPDSNLYDASLPGNTDVHGFGMSFDPTDSSYYYPSVNGGSLQQAVSAAFPLTNGTTLSANPIYIVDSFFAPVTYIRHDASSNDSLIIEFVLAMNSTTDSGAYNLIFQASAANAAITYDSTPRFSTVHYNNGLTAPYNVSPYINDCYFDSILAPRWRFAFALNATTIADTDANGLLMLGMLPANVLSANTSVSYTPSGGAALAFPTPITVNATTGENPHVVSFISFKSGHTGGTYPLNTPIASANYIKLYAGDPLGTPTTTGPWFMQSASNASQHYAGSFQASLMAFNGERYSNTSFEYNNHNILAPSSAFAEPDFVVTEQEFHIQWNPIVNHTGIAINTLINNVVAYPNPANNELTVAFSAGQNVEANVSVVNMLGQVVAQQTTDNGRAVFNTSSLASGMYIYTIEANGVSTKGHVVVAH